jgi:hypothetical protein
MYRTTTASPLAYELLCVQAPFLGTFFILVCKMSRIHSASKGPMTLSAALLLTTLEKKKKKVIRKGSPKVFGFF